MQRVLKHSKQRDALYALLCSVKTHPTAEWLYTELKKEYPNISLATVYRNLRLLCETGKAITITVGDGTEHYDATVEPHCHFFCRGCRCVNDIEVPLAKEINSEAESHNNIKVESNNLIFYGLCSYCK